MNNTGRDWLTKDEAEAFIGKNSIYYLDKWRFHAKSSLKGWNWAAGIFSIEWMAYRKMYVEALLYFLLVVAASFILNIIFFILGTGFEAGRLLGDIFRVLIGIFGNALYRKKALRILRKTENLSSAERLRTLSEKGGTSVIAVIVCIAIEIAYVVWSLSI